MRSLRPRERNGLIIALCLVIAAAAAVGISSIPRRKSEPVQPTAPLQATPFLWPGTSRPAIVSAAAAGLADDEIVIGVLVNGKARAYRRRAFAGMTRHVVNDVLGTTPVTVTHCDKTGCSRVYTADGTEPLRVMTGGYSDGLLLKIDDVFYHQATGRRVHDTGAPDLPYALVPLEEVTWGKWRAAHPDTDVYVGSASAGPNPDKAKE
jgi:Protein of unknown function (DUF3179)